MRRKTAIASIIALFLVMWGNAYAYAPGSNDLQMTSPAGGLVEAEEGPSLIIDGQAIDLTQLLNSQIPLLNGQETGVFSGGITKVIHGEKRVQITLNNAVIGMQFLNAAVARTGSSIALNFSGNAQAALVITAPQVDMLDKSVSLDTLGAGRNRLCCLLDLKKKNGKTEITDIRQFSFSGKAAQNLLLVNGANPLGKDYVPPNLTAIPKTVPAVQSKADMKLNSEAIVNLEAMLKAAKKEGVSRFVLSSTYRTYSYQSMLFNNKVKQLNSEQQAATIVARPGTSEHQSALAIDFSTAGAGLSEGFAKTPQGKWLGSNGWKYGYILRYPADKTGITKIIYEPWHFRYVGYPYSKIMYDRKLCLEQFTDNIKTYGYYAVSDQNNTFVAVFDSANNKIYLSEPVSKAPGV